MSRQRKKNIILAGTAFLSGFLCYGIIGAITADKTRIMEIDNLFVYILMVALLGGYIIFSITCGIMVTANWLSKGTLKRKIFFAILWIIPLYFVMLGLFYSVPYFAYNVFKYKKLVTIQNHPYSKIKSGWPEIAFLIAS